MTIKCEACAVYQDNVFITTSVVWIHISLDDLIDESDWQRKFGQKFY